MDKTSLDYTNKLLKTIIALLIRNQGEPATTLKQQIEVLDDLGLKPVEIADILGRSNSYISKELSGIRKSRKGTK